MINRNNKKLVDKFLEEKEGEDLCKETIQVLRDHLLLLLEFSGDTEFKYLPRKYTGKEFKEYLRSLDARRDLIEKTLSSENCRKALGTSRAFFTWLKMKRVLKEPFHTSGSKHSIQTTNGHKLAVIAIKSCLRLMRPGQLLIHP